MSTCLVGLSCRRGGVTCRAIDDGELNEVAQAVGVAGDEAGVIDVEAADGLDELCCACAEDSGGGCDAGAEERARDGDSSQDWSPGRTSTRRKRNICLASEPADRWWCGLDTVRVVVEAVADVVIGDVHGRSSFLRVRRPRVRRDLTVPGRHPRRVAI